MRSEIASEISKIVAPYSTPRSAAVVVGVVVVVVVVGVVVVDEVVVVLGNGVAGAAVVAVVVVVVEVVDDVVLVVVLLVVEESADVVVVALSASPRSFWADAEDASASPASPSPSRVAGAVDEDEFPAVCPIRDSSPSEPHATSRSAKMTPRSHATQGLLNLRVELLGNRC